MNQSINFRPIGKIRTQFNERTGTPRQSVGAEAERGSLEIFPIFQEGLRDLDGFSHLIVLFQFNRNQGYRLTVEPPWSNVPRGIFSTSSYERPNPIGMSVIQVERIEDGTIYFRGVDMLDETPVLDIRPYIPDLYPREKVKTGWMKPEHIRRMLGGKSGV